MVLARHCKKTKPTHSKPKMTRRGPKRNGNRCRVFTRPPLFFVDCCDRPLVTGFFPPPFSETSGARICASVGEFTTISRLPASISNICKQLMMERHLLLWSQLTIQGVPSSSLFGWKFPTQRSNVPHRPDTHHNEGVSYIINGR